MSLIGAMVLLFIAFRALAVSQGIINSVMWPILFTYARHQREAFLYTFTGVGQREEASLTVHFPRRSFCSRRTHMSSVHALNNTPLSSPLNRPSHSVFPRI